MKTTHVDYEIGTQFVLALEYGYADDLSVDEARALVRWEACLMDGYTDLDGQEYEYMYVTPTGDEDEFGLCEITNMRGRTATVRAVYRQVLTPAFEGWTRVEV